MYLDFKDEFGKRKRKWMITWGVTVGTSAKLLDFQTKLWTSARKKISTKKAFSWPAAQLCKYIVQQSTGPERHSNQAWPCIY